MIPFDAARAFALVLAEISWEPFTSGTPQPRRHAASGTKLQMVRRAPPIRAVESQYVPRKLLVHHIEETTGDSHTPPDFVEELSPTLRTPAVTFAAPRAGVPSLTSPSNRVLALSQGHTTHARSQLAPEQPALMRRAAIQTVG